ncbi:hypothetical protein HN51_067256 [Arachis hypogaea]
MAEHHNVAMATAAKAKLLLRELKTVKADLAFAKARFGFNWRRFLPRRLAWQARMRYMLGKPFPKGNCGVPSADNAGCSVPG